MTKNVKIVLSVRTFNGPKERRVEGEGFEDGGEKNL
jgi:hypothetical protein